MVKCREESLKANLSPDLLSDFNPSSMADLLDSLGAKTLAFNLTVEEVGEVML